MKRVNEPTPTARRPDYRRIAEGLRREITSGKFSPGEQLPSTRELAQIWKSSVFTVHTAVHALVKEGWVERLGGAGTYVANFKNRFACAGIYHGSDIFAREASVFSRALHTSLLKQLRKLKKETLVFIDSRPSKKQGKLLPELAEAILHRRIQCLIAPSVNEYSLPVMARLGLPTTFAPSRYSSHSVDVDRDELIRLAVWTLARQGCRSIGLIGNIVRPRNPKDSHTPWASFYRTFEKAARAEKLATQDRWIREPSAFPEDQELFGYQEFRKLWALRDKPDGMIIYPDQVCRGAILAIASLGVRVPEQMKFVFHRNSRSRVLCPFPATWANTDEAAVAAEIIRMIQRQFAGEKVSPVFVPHVFTSEKGEA